MRSNRSSPVAPVAPVAAEGAAVMTMAQMAEMMRSLQATVEASRVEQARMHEDLVASRARNEELNKMTEELRQALQEQQGRSAAEEVAPSLPPRVFPCLLFRRSRTRPFPRAWFRLRLFSPAWRILRLISPRSNADDAVRRVRRRLLQDVREYAPGNGVRVVREPA